jgi:hypothetical protein
MSNKKGNPYQMDSLGVRFRSRFSGSDYFAGSSPGGCAATGFAGGAVSVAGATAVFEPPPQPAINPSIIMEKISLRM